MSDRQWTFLVWGLLGLAVVACLAASALSRGRLSGPGALVERITAHRSARVVLVLAWMWLGWHLFAR